MGGIFQNGSLFNLTLINIIYGTRRHNIAISLLPVPVLEEEDFGEDGSQSYTNICTKCHKPCQVGIETEAERQEREEEERSEEEERRELERAQGWL